MTEYCPWYVDQVSYCVPRVTYPAGYVTRGTRPPGGSIASVEWGGGVDAVLPAVLSALNADGMCVVKNAMSAATAAAIREQMEAHNETYVLSALTMAQLTLQTSAAG
eukprot:COSAG06_NODE_1219_length_10212_cov_51.453080_9_plen_107_part_00